MKLLKIAGQTFDEEMEEWIDKWVDDGGNIEVYTDPYDGISRWDAHTPDGKSTYTSDTPEDLLHDLKSYYKMQGFVKGLIG